MHIYPIIEIALALNTHPEGTDCLLISPLISSCLNDDEQEAT
jgi:hypothetical protein